MSTPEELLCSRKWRMAHGLWMLFGWFPLALTAWIGYLIIGVRARNWRWILLSVGFFAFGTVMLGIYSTFPEVAKNESYPAPYDTYSRILSGITLVVWLGNAVGLQWWINRRWLVWRARNDRRVSMPWYATATQGPAPAAAASAGLGPAVDAAFASTDRSVPAGGAEPLDLNAATADQLAALPGFDVETAARVVAAREAVGGFVRTADLVARAGVKPHVFAAIQDRVVARDRVAASPPAPPPVEVPASGRRLEF